MTLPIKGYDCHCNLCIVNMFLLREGEEHRHQHVNCRASCGGTRERNDFEDKNSVQFR